MIIFNSKTELVKHMTNVMNAQSYGLYKSLDQHFTKELNCKGSADFNDAMINRFRCFQIEVDPFEWITNDGSKMILELRNVHIITSLGDDEDDVLFESFIAYNNPKE